MSILNTRWPLAIIVFATLIFLGPREADAGDPTRVYRTIKSEHFNIHYHQGLEEMARQAAGICEDVYFDLSIVFGWAVDGPIQVVITDSTDSANGSAGSYGRPVIRLYASSPTLGAETQTYDHWMRLLITHEYTHINQMDIHYGLAHLINSIFGDIYLPNTLSPRWFFEGIAVLNETLETTSGRIRSQEYKMTIRTDALQNKFMGLAEISNPSNQFPRGGGQYIYGAMFMDYLHKRFGREKLIEIFHIYGASVIPYGLNRTFKQALGVDLVTLWDDWTDQVKEKAKITQQRLAEQGLTKSTAITAGGEFKGRPLFTPDGKNVLMGINGNNDRSGIFKVPLDGSSWKRIAYSGSSPKLSMDRSGRLFYTRSAPYKNTYHFGDLFIIDELGRDPRRLTNGLRVREAAVSPRGDQVAMTLNKLGKTKLVIGDDRGNVLDTLLDPSDYDQVFSPVWSPDGDKLAFVWRKGPQVDVALMTIDDRKITFITNDRSLEGGPTFDPSGRYLLYASERTGINNIFAYDLDQKKTLQITNVVTGAFKPAISPDGTLLAFTKYSSIGYDLHLMPFEPAKAKVVAPVESDAKYPQIRPLPPSSEAPTKPYNPLPTFLPYYWNAGFATGTNELSATTVLSDVVGRHNMGVQLDYRIHDPSPSVGLSYSYFGLRPGLHFSFSRRLDSKDSGYKLGGVSRQWTQEVIRGSGFLSFPISGLDRSHSLGVGYSIIHARPRTEPEMVLDPNGSIPTVPRQYYRTGINTSWGFSNAFTPARSISPEKGRKLSASVDLYHPSFGGRQTVAMLRYGWTEYVKMPWLEHHVFAFRLSGGAYISDPPGQASFSVGGYAEQDLLEALRSNQSMGLASLRGYPSGAFSGDRFQTLRLEYRLPLWFANLGYHTLPVFLRKFHARIFSDNALIGFDEFKYEDWRSCLGGELVWSLTVGYHQNMTLRTGYAYGFMDRGVHEVIIVLGSGF